MKELPKIIGEEKRLKIDYAIMRELKSKRAIKTVQNQPNVWFTVKTVETKGIPFLQVQFHLRFPGKDHYTGEEEVIDVDFYMSQEEFKKLIGEQVNA